jgi:NitT/TauT family transport system substrate-binding protein
MSTSRRSRRLVLVSALAVVAVLAGACGSISKKSTAAAPKQHVDLRLGYFPNITHAPALVGLQQGILGQALGADVTLQPKSFNAGPAAVEALFSDALDATFIGPSPSITAFTRSHGDAVRIISGTASGGAALVVKPSINSPADLKGKKLASPQLGNTQDVSLRTYLGTQGLKTDPQGGGDVSILPQDNAQTLDTFRSGAIDGAWVPEPWVTRLVQEGGGKVLVDERTLWPEGKFVTTNLLVTTKFLKAHPDVVERLLKGLVQTVDAMKADPAKAQQSANDAIAAATGKALKPATIAAAWNNLEFTLDPLPATLEKQANDAKKLGLIDSSDVKGIYDLTLLHKAQGA